MHPARTSRIRRWLPRLLVLLIAGAIINVAVAWSCALWSPTPYLGYEHLGRIHAIAASRYIPRDWLLPWYGYSSDLDAEMLAEIMGTRPQVLPQIGSSHWVGFGVHIAQFQRSPQFLDSVTPDRLKVYFVGLPFHSLVGSAKDPQRSGQTPIWRDAIEIPAHAASDSWDGFGGGAFSRRMPIRPLRLGFIANSLIYATVIAALYHSIACLRQLHRFRRGRCPRCGYQIGPLAVCPECGTPNPFAATPTSS